MQRIIYWPLEKNEDAFRINVKLDGITHCYITPNNEYLVTQTKNESMQIWNIFSRTMIEEHQLDVYLWFGAVRALNGTSDSKFIFF